MKRKLLAMLLIAAMLLTACSYVVVEDQERTRVGSLLSAYAEEEASAAYEASPLKRGSRGEDVRRLQKLLAEYGFLNGKADGVFGAQTEKAVREAQAYKKAQDQREAEKIRKEVLDTIDAAFDRTRLMLLALSTEDDAGEIRKSEFTLVNIIPSAEMPEPQKKEKIDGQADAAFMNYLESGFSPVVSRLLSGSSGADVRRLQTRLNAMYYLYGGIDGYYGSNTAQAVKYFQRLNGLAETGIADEETQSVLFSESCKVSDYPMYPYRIEVDVSDQKVYVYKWNYGAYSKLEKTMICTTGAVDTPTPLGSFKMGGPCGRWYYFEKFECWAQYASRITGGILFHSVLYSDKDESTLRRASLNALGSRGSHGCIRLKVEDAKWIYNNIAAGTTCTVRN